MKALITATFHPDALARLRRWMDVVYEDWRQSHKLYFSGEEFAAKIRAVGADVLIVEADLVHEEVIEGCGLRIIGAARGDPVNIRIDLATARGIPVLFCPARNAEAVAELTVAFMLCVARRVHEIYFDMRAGKLNLARSGEYLSAYGRLAGIELQGKTVGIVGFGAIGQRVARILRGFESRVVAYDPYAGDGSFAALGAERRDLDSVIAAADFLTLHCPESPETDNLIHAERIRALKPGAYVMNLARGRILDEDALYDGLRTGRIAGAGLDVFAVEPLLPGNRFLELPNVVALPHFGGNTHETVLRQSEMMVSAIDDLRSGRRPKNVCNPEVLDGAASRGPTARG